MALRPDVVRRILLAKSILAPYGTPPWGEPDAFTVARQVLTSHDAADLVFAAIVDHQGGPSKTSAKTPSMVESLNMVQVNDRVQKPITYFISLNDVRNSLKHRGILPNTRQWGNVGTDTYKLLSQLCQDCVGAGLDDLDESELLADPEAKEHFAAAKVAAEVHDYRRCLEELGKALCVLLDGNPVLSRIGVGEASAENAIMLSGFGVDANTFLRLQEFLPKVLRLGNEPFHITWAQSKFGHPGNWREEVAGFCLQAFLQIGPKIQDAKWIPPAIELWHLYDYRITAREDTDIWGEGNVLGPLDVGPRTNHQVGQLREGESVTVTASHQLLVKDRYDEVARRMEKVVMLPASDVISFFLGPRHFVPFDKVTITCVPRSPAAVRELFPGLGDLAEMPWAEDDAPIEE